MPPPVWSRQRGFVAGQVVRVTPGDYAQDPVTGRLVGLAPDEIALAREDPRAGRMHVHFPRIGYRVETTLLPRGDTAAHGPTRASPAICGSCCYGTTLGTHATQ
jgi:hypothetical protein